MSWEIEWEKKKKGFRKDFTHVQGKQTKEEHGMEREVELQSLQVDFQKECHLHIVDWRTSLKKETHSEAIGPHDKANYSNSNGGNTITLYSNDNDN